MALEDFFDHACNIYHIQERGVSPGYALPPSPDFSYPEEPDIADIPCHFEIKGMTESTMQGQPADMLEATRKLVLPAGTDIRINDKVVDTGTGYQYTAEEPHNIRGHHVFCYVKRRDMNRQKDI